MTLTRVSGQLLFLLLGCVVAASTAPADEQDRVFAEPPDPEVLAGLLFGPKYRGAQMQDAQVPGRFGMMINFDYDSTKIMPESLPLLDSVGEMLGLESAANAVLLVEGHADAMGPATYNQGLSERRAEAVKRYLVGTFDLPAEQLITIGEGESKLHNKDEPYDAINRRVVFRTNRSIVLK